MNLPPLGLDVAKLKFNACLVRAGGKLRHKVFTNNPAGFAQLSNWLSQQAVTQAHACMEATGAYGDSLATYLHEQDHLVSIVNPAAIKAYAQSPLSRTKTDRVDAALIARFCSERKPPAWRPPERQAQELQGLVRRLESLIEMRTSEENRLSSGIVVEAVRESVEQMLAHLAEQIKKTETLIRDLIGKHPDLKKQRQLLDSIPGIGETTAAVLLAEVPDITQHRSARQVAAFAGLVPRERQSGSSVRGRVRLSKIGNSRLRKALYFPAITALRCSPFFQAWAKGLRERGKSKMAVIGAAMRKLLHLAYGVLKTGRPFDPEWTQKAKLA
jgi:transposase